MASAAILVGGQASRFAGRDKSALIVGGRAIIDRQLEQLRQITDDILLVGRDTGHRSQHVRIVPDRVPDSGPLGGLEAALASARDESLVLIACDMPFVTARFLEHLLNSTHGADAVVPRTQRGYHPLCAVYTRACQPPLARRLAERRLKMLDFFEDVQVHVVDSDAISRFGDAERLLANVNTPDELQNVETLLGHEL